MGSSLDDREAAIRERSKKDLVGYWISFGVIVLGFAVLFTGPGWLKGAGGGLGVVGLLALMVFAIRSKIDDLRWFRLRRKQDLDRAAEQRDKFI